MKGIIYNAIDFSIDAVYHSYINKNRENKMSLVKDIRVICNQLSDDELTRLKLEEDLLVNLVKSVKHRIPLKKEAFARIGEINRTQLVLLGQTNLGY